MLFAGEGRADITPPNGTVLAGFHFTPGNERVVTGVRQPPQTRALALRVGESTALILSLEILAVSQEFTKSLQQRIALKTGVKADHIRVCATHTHSMPTFREFLQWGSVSKSYMELVAERTEAAAVAAIADLSEADCYFGTQNVTGGNFNRTTPNWKTDEAFTAESTDDERWLDTRLQALYFQRADGKRPLLWYPFSAHPVVFGDGNAGPDWPGIVASRISGADGAEPGYLQGHIGDVNPGDGTPWIGDPEETASAIAPALHFATGHGDIVEVDALRIVNGTALLPYDLDRFKKQRETYAADPAKCADGEWVDAGFAKAWSEEAAKWDLSVTAYSAPISAMRLGSLLLLFHPSELYSYYGIKLRVSAPTPNVLVVGYCDDFVGYLTDPKAYTNGEYAAVVVPKILGLPPFSEDAARRFTNQCQELLNKLA